MPRHDRRGQLVRRLREDGRASVGDAGPRSRRHAVDDPPRPRPAGRRRRPRPDLRRRGAGRGDRVAGGAVAARPPRRSGRSAPPRPPLVEDGQTIAISSGSTTLELARRLVDRRLTVITNALDVASVLLDRDGIELVVLGGVVRPRMHSMLGHLAELALRELRADTLFMGIGALDPDHGLMNDSIPEILTDRALRRSARSCVVLADSSQVRPGRPRLRLRARRGRHRRHRRRGRPGRRRSPSRPAAVRVIVAR